MTSTVQRPEAPGTGAGFTTVSSMLRDWAVNHPDLVVMREKDFGIWQEYTAATAWDHVIIAAHGLLSLGVDFRDVVSIHSEDRPEWVILDLATVAIRAITTGMYPTNPVAETKYLLQDSGAKVHLAEDQEQVDKVMDIESSEVPALIKVLYVEPRGLQSYRDPRLMSWDDFLSLGAAHREKHPGAVEALMAAAEPDDIMTLVYTSGTTGPPKGAMLTNSNVSACIDMLVSNPARFPNKQEPHPGDVVLTYLPLCHVAERIFSEWHMVGGGVTLNFAESIDTVQANLREVQPTLFFAVPRIWEKIHATVVIKINDGTRFKRAISGVGLKMAGIIGRARVGNNGYHTISSQFLYWIGNLLVFRALKERIGMRRVRWAGSGAAPIAPEVLEFFMGLGLPVFELYGMTENAAVATLNFPGRVKLGTVGEPYPGIDFRIDESTGEIQNRSEAMFIGYWNKPDKTAETFTEDGWLKSGDVGVWVDGTHVKIVDRVKDIIITSGGKNIAPSELENSLKASPYIKEAMVIGDRRKYVTALIGIEFDTVGNWALRRSLPYTTYRDLSEKPEVIDLVQGIVNETNAKFSRVEEIKRFRMIPKELDHEDGELTATQKLKRDSMIAMFGDLVDDLYT